MDGFEWRWKTLDGLELFSRGWAPANRPKAVVCLVHGIREHTKRYAYVAQQLTQAGYVFLGFDLRGHGLSEGQRGHTPSIEHLLEDIQEFMRQAQQRYPDAPLVLYGHSLGGNLVSNYLLRLKPTLPCAVVTGPQYRLSFAPPPSKMALGRMMSNISPTFSQATGLELTALSRDPAVVSAYADDPLIHDRISTRMFVSIMDAGEWALEHAAELTVPLLIMHGSADRLTSAEAAQEFARRAGEKATLKLWPGLYHEIHNEPEKDAVLQTMTIWLDQRLS